MLHLSTHLSALSSFFSETAYLNGLYVGFVEWKAPPDGLAETKWWKLGFITGFILKAAIFVYVGARFVP